MPKYELYNHAGEIPFNKWLQKGILIPVFDKDNTITVSNDNEFIKEVIEGLIANNLSDIYPRIALVSNNKNIDHIHKIAKKLENTLGVSEVFCVCQAKGYKRKPNPEMGLVVAEHFGVKPEELGIIGDRRLVDVSFGGKLKAGAIALCKKVSPGDATFVPTIRKFEKIIVSTEKTLGIANLISE
jgi:HAD superfamily hydrolase (TIGR01662 family)